MSLGAVLAVLLAAVACSGVVSSSDPKKVPAGDWGGQHVRLTVTDVGGVIEFDCAHGTLDQPLVLSDDGRFDVKGRYTPEHGGPVRKDEPDQSRPARYTGSTDGHMLTLTLTPEDGETLGPFELQLGQKTRLFKCL